MRMLVGSMIGALIIAISIIWGCSKTIIRNEVVIKEEPEWVKPTKLAQRDSTKKDDTLHEIGFCPAVIGWEVISGGDTIRVEI